MPVSMYLVICKKPFALDNYCEDENNNRNNKMKTKYMANHLDLCFVSAGKSMLSK